MILSTGGPTTPKEFQHTGRLAPVRAAPMMSAALVYIEELRDHHAPMLRAANMHELRLVLETCTVPDVRKS